VNRKPKCGNEMDNEYDLPHSDTTQAHFKMTL